MRRHRQAKGNEVFTRRKQKCVLSNPYQNGKSNGTSLLVFLDHAFISINGSWLHAVVDLRLVYSSVQTSQCQCRLDYSLQTYRAHAAQCLYACSAHMSICRRKNDGCTYA
eukprot:scpid67346/ scgid13313/ 